MKKILIVDDDPLMGNVYREKFLTLGFDVDLADSGRLAIAKLGESVPSLVLLDLVLGDITGVDVLKFLRDRPATKDLPVLVLTNAYMGELIQAAWKAGANKCLSKTSCSPNRLVDEVQTLLATVPKRAAEPPPVTPAPPPPRPAPSGDERVQAQLRSELVETVRRRLDDARSALQDIVRHAADGTVANGLPPLFRAIHAIAGSAGLAGCARLVQVAAASEALVAEMQASPGKINVSTLRTLTQAIELMPVLFKKAGTPQDEVSLSPLILIVDDDPISREILRTALERAQLRALVLGDPLQAQQLFESNRFDLVLLDVDMPGMNGFELCEKLHLGAGNLMTPVIFVTALSDFETRSQSSESGAVDFIAKPVVTIELAVKALIHLHRGRVLAAM